MCNYDFDPPEFSCETPRKARNPRPCYGCGRKIVPGEIYTWFAQKVEGRISTFAECAQCRAAAKWLQGACEEGFSADIAQEIIEHAPEHPSISLYRLSIYAKRQWRATDSAGAPLVSPEAIAALVERAPVHRH